jgi:hypothetical protein
MINELENSIIITDKKGEKVPYTLGINRNKEIKLSPEEVVRQLYLKILTEIYNYPLERIAVEYSVSFGRETKRADIIIFDKDRTTFPLLILIDSSKKLSEVAKHAVEIAIEEDEETSFSYINKQIISKLSYLIVGQPYRKFYFRNVASSITINTNSSSTTQSIRTIQPPNPLALKLQRTGD